jgi:nucleoside-diphosphate-sugar epimerase
MDNKTVFVIGCDGYIGHALTLRLLKLGYKVIGIDDFRRRRAVKEMNSFSAIPIKSLDEKIEAFKKLGDFTFFSHSLEKEYDRLSGVFSLHKPDIIVNLAQQPSAPYSHKSRKHAIETTYGNLIGTINILYAIKEVVPGSHLIQIGSMGEYNPAIGVDIPEGIFDFNWQGKVAKGAIFPRRPGSFYHCSKVASTYYIDAACRWWGIKATDIMQGVVFGNWTPEIEETGLHTRLDSDESFGTVVNRFIIQVLLDHPLTIYGEGKQKRGFLSLNDSVQCLMLAIENPPEFREYRTWNQLDTIYSMKDIAHEVAGIAIDMGVASRILYNHIDSPRVEDTSDFYYKPVVEKLKSLGFKPTRKIRDDARFAFEVLKDNKEILQPLKKVVMPKINWRNK